MSIAVPRNIVVNRIDEVLLFWSSLSSGGVRDKKIHSTTEFQRVTHSTEEIGRKGVDYSFETFTHEGKQKEMDVRQGSFNFLLILKMGNIRVCMYADIDGAMESC